MSSKGKRGKTVRGARPVAVAAPRRRQVDVPPSRTRQAVKWVVRGLAVGLLATVVTLSGTLPSHPSAGDIVVTIVVRTVVYGAVFSVLWFALDVGQRWWKRTRGQDA